MKIDNVPAALLLCLTLAPVSAQGAQETPQAASTESKKTPKTEKKGGAPDEAAAMKAWQDFMTPGEAHKKLDATVGSWTAHTKMWMAPGTPAQESDGTAEMAWIMGGRYVEEKFHGMAMGQPFEGQGWSGYDNYKKKYVGTWIDNMGTGIMTMAGTFDATGKVMTSWGTIDDVVMKRPAKIKSISTMSDPDHMLFEMFSPDPSGKPFKSLEIAYERKK